VLHPYLALLVRHLPDIGRELGITIRVTSAFRSPQKQRELYGAFKAGKMPYVVAAPGSSKHERGLAIDVVSNDLETLVTLLRDAAGLRWAGMRDPVHFEIP